MKKNKNSNFVSGDEFTTGEINVSNENGAEDKAWEDERTEEVEGTKKAETVDELENSKKLENANSTEGIEKLEKANSAEGAEKLENVDSAEDVEDIDDDVDNMVIFVDDEEALAKAEKDYRRHKRNRKIIKISSIVIGAIVLIYGAGIWFFSSHFLFFTKVNDVDVQLKDAKYLDDYMSNLVDNYTLTLKESDGTTEVIEGKQIDATYINDDSVENLIKKQNNLLWIKSLWKHPNVKAKVGVTYDEVKFDDVLKQLPCSDTEKQVPSVNAHPEFVDSEFVIIEEKTGTQLSEPKFKSVVEKAINGFQPEVDLLENGAYVPPKYLKESKEVIAARDAMNSYIKANVTYDFNPATEVVNAPVIAPWVKVDDEMRVSFDDEAVKAFIANLAAKYDTKGTTRQFTTANGNVVAVEGGSFGWTLDQGGEYAALTDNIQKGETVTREAVFASRGVSHEPNRDVGGTFVEVDLTNQHLWYWQDGQLALETDVVTGRPNGHATHSGTFSIAFKASPSVLRGKKSVNPETGEVTYEYETNVQYWMPFNGGEGLHDAGWQPWFGGNRYTFGGSHGCVNMPPAKAGELYGMVSAGTPVVVHY
jgi:hypothetical protein